MFSFHSFQESERLVEELTETWEERLKKSEAIKAERYLITKSIEERISFLIREVLSISF